MSFILNSGIVWQVQYPAKGIPKAICDPDIVSRAVPDGQDVLVVADGHDGAADLLSNHKLLAEHGHDQVFPTAGRKTFP